MKQKALSTTPIKTRRRSVTYAKITGTFTKELMVIGVYVLTGNNSDFNIGNANDFTIEDLAKHVRQADSLFDKGRSYFVPVKMAYSLCQQSRGLKKPHLTLRS
jgi:hypothetical protein